MSIKTDCWSLDIAFYKWAAKRLTYFIDCQHRPVVDHLDQSFVGEWANTLTEMRDTFQHAADTDETVWKAPSPRLCRALKLWADNIQYLWN